MRLCSELETHVKCDIRESEKCLYRSKVGIIRRTDFFFLSLSLNVLQLYFNEKVAHKQNHVEENKIYFPSLNSGEGFGGQNLHQVANPSPEDKTVACTVVTHFNVNF